MIKKNTTYKQTSIGLIPSDWEVKKLGDVIEYKKGFAFKTIQYKNEGVRIIRVSDTNAEGIKKDGNVYIDINEAKNHSEYQLLENDIVIQTVGSRPPMYDSMVGKTILVNKEFKGSLLNQNAVRLRAKNGNNNFLFSLFRRKEYLDFIKTLVRGNANQVSITLEDLFKYQIPYPKLLPEQQKIATILSNWDAAIDTTKQIIEKLQLRNRGLAQKLLTGKIRVKGFEKTKWVEKKADKIFKSHTDKTHEGEPEILSATQDRGVIPRSMSNYDIKYDENSLGTYKKVEVGDYVISLRSFQGGIEYSEYEGIVSPAYTILKEINPISKTFFKVYFKTETFINRLNTIIYGIRDGKQISFGDFATLNLPFPTIEEQELISKILNTSTSEFNHYQQKLKTLQLQKKGLMQQLLTGKIRVKI